MQVEESIERKESSASDSVAIIEMPYNIALGRDWMVIKSLVSYGYEDDSVAFALVIEERNPLSFREVEHPEKRVAYSHGGRDGVSLEK